ncbi:MAG: hypothetical protein KatS3mg002_0233 [Candidatus Woesearchaeota archaeon]|nr:MAG: hypothetical protein KatS3mg002_0233 [Candidatus Woesearchaeota archaeon]
MNKFAISADWHFSNYSNDKKDIKGLSRKLIDLVKTIVNMCQYCLKNDIDTIIVAGDLFHNKSIVHTVALSIVSELFNEYKNIQFILIDGNHDLTGKGSEVASALKPFTRYDNVRVISGKSEKIGNVYFVPYIQNMKENIINGNAEILISHFGLNEATLDSGISIRTDISINDLKHRYQKVFLGHYHKPQDLITPDIAVYYAGSPIQLSWGEKNQDKRFLVYDNENIFSIPTEGYTKLIEFLITEDNKEHVLNEVQQLKEQNVEVTLKTTDKTLHIDFDNVRIIDISEEDITNRGLSQSMTKRDIFVKYLDIKEIENKDEYLNYILSVLET